MFRQVIKWGTVQIAVHVYLHYMANIYIYVRVNMNYKLHTLKSASISLKDQVSAHYRTNLD